MMLMMAMIQIRVLQHRPERQQNPPVGFWVGFHAPSGQRVVAAGALTSHHCCTDKQLDSSHFILQYFYQFILVSVSVF